jgi:predicted RNase H-like HicB family nuclease
MKHYHINLFYSVDDGGWIADVPDLKLCSAFGETPEQALAEVRIAMDGWLSTARKLRKAIPKPAYRPAIYHLAAS